MIFYKAHIILIFFICVIIVSILINPVKYIQSALDGLIVWATVIVPAVFPFLFFSLALIELEWRKRYLNILSLTSKLFKTGGVSAYIFFMSLISGYPIGAKLIEDFYNKGFIDSYEGARIISFCSMASPMFVLGSVGIGLLKSYAAGLILLISQILSNIINGLIFSNYKSKNFQSKLLIAPQPKNADNVLSECVYNPLSGIDSSDSATLQIAEILNDIYFLYP